jgi:hypothetical protein
MDVGASAGPRVCRARAAPHLALRRAPPPAVSVPIDVLAPLLRGGLFLRNDSSIFPVLHSYCGAVPVAPGLRHRFPDLPRPTTAGLFLACCVVPATPGRMFGGFRRYASKGWEAKLTGRFRDDPDFWRFQAEEVRMKSRQINDPGSKYAVQEVAGEYDRIACRIEERVKDWRSTRPHCPHSRRSSTF